MVNDQNRCTEALLEAVGANVNGSPAGTETPLMSTAAIGDEGRVRSLIEGGALVNWGCEWRDCPHESCVEQSRMLPRNPAENWSRYSRDQQR